MTRNFVVDKSGGESLFSVPDFIGDACKAIASRIRGAVASVKFDDFHKNSAKIIRSSVFGLDEKSKVRDRFTFPANNLHITSVDIQSVEPVDQRTRDALQKSVQLAIEITTASQEASAKYNFIYACMFYYKCMFVIFVLKFIYYTFTLFLIFNFNIDMKQIV